MLILLDIGNTAITYGRYEGGRLLESGSCLSIDIPKKAKKWLKSGDKSNNNLVISSVSPKITAKIRKSFHKAKGWKIGIIGSNLPVPIPHRYQNAKKLGIDRLVNAYGAVKMYKAPVLVIDFGTAITFDYVSRGGIFEGGMIIPGPQVAFQALIEKAALLPKKMRLPEKAASFIGRNTYDCMSSGILEGYGALADGLIQRFKDKFGEDVKVVATGGFAGTLKPFSKRFEIVDPLHSIKSLLLLYKNKK